MVQRWLRYVVDRAERIVEAKEEGKSVPMMRD